MEIERGLLRTGLVRWQAVTALANFDMENGLRALAQPTLLLVGEHFYYARFLDEVIARVKDLRYDVLAGGRFCMTWERADEIAAKVATFLRS